MNECLPVSDLEPIRQGDILVAHPHEGAPNRFVVITADCDIAQNKTGGQIALLPLLHSEAYIFNEWVNRRLQPLRRTIFEARADRVHTILKSTRPEFERLEIGFVTDWFIDAGITRVVTDVGGDSSDELFFNQCDQALRDISSMIKDITPVRTIIDNYFLIAEKFDPSISVTKVARRRNEIRSILNESRADSFYINDILGANEQGWFVELSKLTSRNDGDLKSARLAWLEEPRFLLRTGRLAPVYKYALTQKFATFYSRIGLPVAHEDWKRAVMEETCERLYPGEGA